MFSLVLGWSSALKDPILLSFNTRGDLAAARPQNAAWGHIHRAASSEMCLSVLLDPGQRVTALSKES